MKIMTTSVTIAACSPDIGFLNIKHVLQPTRREFQQSNDVQLFCNFCLTGYMGGGPQEGSNKVSHLHKNWIFAPMYVIELY